MKRYLGTIARVDGVCEGGIRCNGYYWPFFCLELVSKGNQVKLNQEYSAEIAPDKKTVKVGCQEFSREVILELAEKLK